jgi:hypothetical protein
MAWKQSALADFFLRHEFLSCSQRAATIAIMSASAEQITIFRLVRQKAFAQAAKGVCLAGKRETSGHAFRA